MWFKIIIRALTVLLLVACMWLATMAWTVLQSPEWIIGAVGLMGSAVMFSLVVVLWAVSESV